MNKLNKKFKNIELEFYFKMKKETIQLKKQKKDMDKLII